MRNSNIGANLSTGTEALFADLLKVLIDNEVSILQQKDSLKARLSWNH